MKVARKKICPKCDNPIRQRFRSEWRKRHAEWVHVPLTGDELQQNHDPFVCSDPILTGRIQAATGFLTWLDSLPYCDPHSTQPHSSHNR